MPLLSTFGAASARSFGGIGAAAAGAGLDINEAFSTYLYDGTGSAQTINNGIDLSGEGGLVWMKSRTGTDEHTLMDTVRGIGKSLISHETYAEQDTNNNFITSFNSNGFSLGTLGQVNRSGQDFVSWTFRKAPKFFDVVTYTGNGSASRQISHNLGSVPGMIIVKITSEFGSWAVYHRGNTANPETDYLQLNTTAATVDAADYWADTAPTSTHFTVGSDGDVNQNAATYVAYLFAHNDGDGGFGPSGDQDVIKCGSYTGTGSAQDINVGFEPQFVIFKGIDSASTQWNIVDTMRGLTVGVAKDKVLYANDDGAEASEDANIGAEAFGLTNTGFSVAGTEVLHNKSGDTYIYMAIRRGPLAEPTSATDVFAIDTLDSTAPGFDSNFVVDMAFERNVSSASDTRIASRLTGATTLRTNTTEAESAQSSNVWDFMDGWFYDGSSNSSKYSWMWKRAPGYFDAVAYTGTGSARTVSHNLGVAPEMMWVKSRETVLNATDWWVFHKNLSTPADDSLRLNSTGAENTGNGALLWNSTMPTSSVFSLGTYSSVNQSGKNFIAYLFASVAGVSKVGSYTGNNSTQTIDCGFSSGARFVLIKRTDSSQHWILFDSTRGIVSGNDPSLKLSDGEAEYSGGDDIDPTSSGFIINNDTANGYQLSTSGASYIFYAIA